MGSSPVETIGEGRTGVPGAESSRSEGIRPRVRLYSHAFNRPDELIELVKRN